MPIDQDFTKKYKVTGKHELDDGKNFHYVWGPGKANAEAAQDLNVLAAYKSRGENIEPLGVHGTYVAVDWDSCIADGACLESCPVDVFEWFRNAVDVPAKDAPNTKSPGGGGASRGDRKDYTDKADPIREGDCIWCMACVSVCPPQAVLVEQKNQQAHETANQTYKPSQ